MGATGLAIQMAYVIAAALFIFGLKLLGSAATARKGNLLSATGMLLAIVAALLDQGIVEYQWILLGFVLGGVIGAGAARLVKMTAMPEMVALFNCGPGHRQRHLCAGDHCPVDPDRRPDLYRLAGGLRQAQ